MPKKQLPKPKPFSRLTAAGKRVAIAKDVLKQIKVEQYKIKTGTWLEIEDISNEDIEAMLGESKTQSLLTGKPLQLPAANCTCCAVGAACASAIRIFNNHELPTGEINDLDEGREILHKYFPKSQIDQIEAAFEKRSDEGDLHQYADEVQLSKAVAFGVRFHDPTERAKEIFTNIVKNNGTFIP